MRLPKKKKKRFYVIPHNLSSSSAFSSEPPRVTKDVVCFHAGDFPHVVQRLQLDLHEPPLSQVLHFSHTHTHNPHTRTHTSHTHTHRIHNRRSCEVFFCLKLDYMIPQCFLISAFYLKMSIESIVKLI